MSWLKRNSETLKTLLHITVALIPIVIGGVCVYFDYRGVDPTHLFVYGVVVPVAIYFTVISELAIIWFFKHLKEDDVIYLETYTDASQFANRRAEIIKAIKPEDFKYNVYSTSHCNLFARPEGDSPKQIDAVARINAELFETMVRVALNPNSQGRIRVLLFAESTEELHQEIEQREAILNTVAGVGQWDRDHFRFEILAGKSLKDYLVVEDHVFKTIRKVKSSAPDFPYQGNRAKYIHIQSKKIADSYREWLRDMFENGQGSYVRRR